MAPVAALKSCPEDMEDKFHTFGDRVIHGKYIEFSRDAKATSAHLCAEAAAMNPPKRGPNRKMVKAAFDRHENGETVEHLRRKKSREWERGRLPALDEIGIQAIVILDNEFQ